MAKDEGSRLPRSIETSMRNTHKQTNITQTHTHTHNTHAHTHKHTDKNRSSATIEINMCLFISVAKD